MILNDSVLDQMDEFGIAEQEVSKDALRQRRWRQLNGERNRRRQIISFHRRRAARYGLAEHFTWDEWEACCNFFGNVCVCCGSDESLQIDHIIPFEFGGTNLISNIQPLCDYCNRVKAQKIIDYRPEEFSGGGVNVYGRQIEN